MNKIEIEAISKKLESNVKRPQNSFLNCEKICKYLGIDLPSWDSQLEIFFEEKIIQQCLKMMNDYLSFGNIMRLILILFHLFIYCFY